MEKLNLKTISHGMLFLVSLFFSVGLFINASNIVWLQIVWVVFACASELLKEHMARSIKSQKKLIMSILLFAFSHLPLICVSALASLGFAQMSINSVANIANMESQQTTLVIEETVGSVNELNNSISLADKQIEALMDDQRDLKDRWKTYYNENGASAWAQKQERIELDAINEDIQYWVDKKAEYAEQKTIKVEDHSEIEIQETLNSKDIFNILGEGFGIPGDKMLFYLFLVVVFVIELNLFITADKLKDKADWEKAHELVGLLINDDETINSIEDVENSISLNRKEIKSLLKEISSYSWRGIKLFYKNKKTLLTKHKKKTIMSYLETKKKMEE